MRFSLRRTPAKSLAYGFLGVVLCGITCFGQNASVSGVVNDTSGAVVPKTDVRFTNSKTNVDYRAATDNDGIFRVSGLVPGIYNASVSKQGFKSVLKPNIEVHTADALTVDFTLTIGDVTETVRVESGVPLLETESSTVGQVIGERQVQDTPLNGRNVMNLIALVPGVIPQG